MSPASMSTMSHDAARWRARASTRSLRCGSASTLACTVVLMPRSDAACCLLRPFGQRFGKVGEQHREPQPHRHGEDEARRRFGLAAQRHDPQDGGEDAANVDDKHYRVLGLRARRQLAEAIDNGGLDQRRREHRQLAHILGGQRRVRAACVRLGGLQQYQYQYRRSAQACA